MTTPITIRGTTYTTIKAAAKANGVACSTIQDAIERGTLDHVGERKAAGTTGRRGRPCFINGRWWPSITAASEALGVSHSTICAAIAAGRETVGMGAPKPAKIVKRPAIEKPAPPAEDMTDAWARLRLAMARTAKAEMHQMKMAEMVDHIAVPRRERAA